MQVFGDLEDEIIHAEVAVSESPCSQLKMNIYFVIQGFFYLLPESHQQLVEDPQKWHFDKKRLLQGRPLRKQENTRKFYI